MNVFMFREVMVDVFLKILSLYIEDKFKGQVIFIPTSCSRVVVSFYNKDKISVKSNLIFNFFDRHGNELNSEYDTVSIVKLRVNNLSDSVIECSCKPYSEITTNEYIYVVLDEAFSCNFLHPYLSAVYPPFDYSGHLTEFILISLGLKEDYEMYIKEKEELELEKLKGEEIF